MAWASWWRRWATAGGTGARHSTERHGSHNNKIEQQKVQASAKERGIRCGDAEGGVGETWTGQPRHMVWATLEAKV
jgi:hypothetical protein